MLGAELVLMIALQQPVPVPPPTIALTINDMVVVVGLDVAERLLKSPSLRLRAAAEIALGTRPASPEPVSLAPYDLERERWQRQPAQHPIPDDNDN